MPDMDSSCAPRESAPLPIELSAREQEDQDDFDVLTVIMNREDHHGLWSVAELAQHRMSLLSTEDAINRLLRAGLIHCHADYVFPTRAATRYSQIIP